MDNATKRDLKKQDKFQELTGESIHWAEKHRQQTIIGAVALVVVVAALVGGYSLYEHRTAAAETAFGAAMQTYQTPLVNNSQPTPPGMKTFPDANARAAASQAQFAQVADQYGMTKPGKLAAYFSGLTLAEEGKNGPAEEELKKAASSWESGVSALGKMALAQLYQQTNRDSDAIAIYDELSKSTAVTVPAGEAQLQLAALYESEGKTEQARKIYAELKDKDKDSKGKPGPVSQIASEKLNPQAAQAPGQ
ncbi:coatomer subunit epsilon [Granulicella paludicola]|uniref:coatomer subunit epsilon n=1 Tax=Granulicella paludicola TaxID=474951 RepID=UPI0021E0C1A4|nr:coatomer subunit epsilon [Granulicella paludicola]